MDLGELSNLIKTRRSIRQWQDRPVPEDLLLQAIELATWAPNGGNQQNWRFYVIFNRDTMNAIADAVQESAGQIASWAEATEFLDGCVKVSFEITVEGRDREHGELLGLFGSIKIGCLQGGLVLQLVRSTRPNYESFKAQEAQGSVAGAGEEQVFDDAAEGTGDPKAEHRYF